MLALSTAAITGLFALAVGVVSSLGVVITALLTRESRAQGHLAAKAVSDWEVAWEERGRLLDGMRSDFDRCLARVRVVEQREQGCLEALEDAHRRLALLEERLGVKPGE